MLRNFILPPGLPYRSEFSPRAPAVVPLEGWFIRSYPGEHDGILLFLASFVTGSWMITRLGIISIAVRNC